MENTTRRSFLKSAPLAAGAVLLPAAAAVAAIKQETQKERCARLATELVAELAKLPRSKGKYCSYAETRIGEGDSFVRYTDGFDDGSPQTMTLIQLTSNGQGDK